MMKSESYGYPLVTLTQENRNELIFKTPKETSHARKFSGTMAMLFGGAILLIMPMSLGCNSYGFFAGMIALIFLYQGYKMTESSHNLSYTLKKNNRTIEITEENSRNKFFSFDDITHFSIYKENPKIGNNTRRYFDFVGYITIDDEDYELARYMERSKARSMLQKVQTFTGTENIPIDYKF